MGDRGGPGFQDRLPVHGPVGSVFMGSGGEVPCLPDGFRPRQERARDQGDELAVARGGAARVQRVERETARGEQHEEEEKAEETFHGFADFA